MILVEKVTKESKMCKIYSVVKRQTYLSFAEKSQNLQIKFLSVSEKLASDYKLLSYSYIIIEKSNKQERQAKMSTCNKPNEPFGSQFLLVNLVGYFTEALHSCRSLLQRKQEIRLNTK